jgi:hypothetical protein
MLKVRSTTAAQGNVGAAICVRRCGVFVAGAGQGEWTVPRQDVGESIGVRVEFRYTEHQVARGTRPDAVDGDVWYLLKFVSRLRLTYQIRLLTFGAEQSGVRLVIRVPKGCRLSAPLRDFARRNDVLKIERVS